MKILVVIMMLAAGSFADIAAKEGAKPFIATIGSDGIQHVEIVGGSYFFTPSNIVVKVNVPVELKVRKEPGIVPHNIAMNSPEAGIVFDVNLSEEPKIVKFTPVKRGKYRMYCSKKLLFFESHREKGMEGLLEVVE
ncbi:MAG: quinol oxidase [Deltaproteobacteria bacterium]|nr:quinol oxidase [Deltaproteobacteria bacterium]